MSRTLTQIRQLTAQLTGLVYLSGTADTGGGTTTLVDAPLKAYPDDRLIGYSALLTSGTPSVTELIITDSVQTTGTVTFVPALSSGSPDTLTYELLPFSGTQFLNAIQESALYLYDQGLLVREAWIRMVYGSPLYNADWSYWTSSSVVDGWARNGTGTVARERNSAHVGMTETSLKLSGAADYVALNAKWRRFLTDLRGETVTLYCPVKTSEASAGRVNFNTGSNNYSSYHGGGGGWELLSTGSITVSSTQTVDPIVQLHNETTADVYFGMPFLVHSANLREHPFSVDIMPDGPTQLLRSYPDIDEDAIASNRGFAKHRQMGRQAQVKDYSFYRHHDEDLASYVGVLDFSTSRAPLNSGDFLWVQGAGPLTIPSSATGTTAMELTYSESLLLATEAAIRILSKAAMSASQSLLLRYNQRIAMLRQQFNELAAGVGQVRGAAVLPLRW